MTENQFTELFSKYGNACEYYDKEKQEQVTVYNLWRGPDNKFSLSYHLKFPQKNVQFNFLLDRLSYINSKESVTISFYNGNKKHEKDKLKNIFTTRNINDLKKEVERIFKEYK